MAERARRLVALGSRNRIVGRLAAAVVARPRLVLWGFIALHAAVWTLYATLLWPNLPNDAIEMLYWGREWQLGYYKLPPLPAWVLEGANVVTLGARWAPYAVSQVFVSLSFWATWKLSAEIVGETRAVLAVIALAGIASFGHEAMTFNHDIAELPFWALTGWSLHRALRDGRTVDWALLGVWMGLGMLAKYQFVTFLVPLAIFAVIHPRSRSCLKTGGPYLAIGIATLIVAPNLYWLLTHDFYFPLRYAMARAQSEPGAWGHVVLPLEFALSQLGLIGCVIASLVALRGSADQAAPLRDVGSFDRWYVGVLALGPFLFTIAAAAIFARPVRATWGFAMWGFLGTFGVMTVARAIDESSVRRFFAVTAALFGAVLLATAALEGIVQPYLGHSKSMYFPGAELAARVESGWRAATRQARLRYVVGTFWLAGNVSYHASDRPSVHLLASPALSSWIDVDDLRRRGAVVLWEGQESIRVPPPELYPALYPTMIVQPPLVLARPTWVRSEPVYVEWAIVPPAGD